MFSPGTRRPNPSSRKDRNLGQTAALDSSPATPLPANRTSSLSDSAVPGRPVTGTPAPWTSRLSVRARIPPANIREKGDDADSTQPVYVGEFPKAVRDEQASFLQKRPPIDAYIHGGIDKEASLSWMLCGNKLFVWSYLSPSASRRCVILDLPPEREVGDSRLSHGDDWLLCVVNWDERSKDSNNVGIVLCNKKSRALIYWPDIYSKNGTSLVLSLASPDESEATSCPGYGKNIPFRQQQYSKKGSSLFGSSSLTSLIASAIPDALQTCVALGCSSNGELWLFHCSPTVIHRRRFYSDIMSLSSLGTDSGPWYPRSLVWKFSKCLLDGYSRQFFLLTDQEIHCFVIDLSPDLKVSRLWSCEIIGSESNSGIKDLTGQKKIWPLDLQIDENGKVFCILVATLCDDRASSSSYMEYSLLRMQYKSGFDVLDFNEPIHEKILEKIAFHVIIPKARVEEQISLFSMKLRVGGKPSGSVIVLSDEGTAIVSHFWDNSARLYRFDLPYDAGKVLDASVFPSTDDTDHVSWVVLTEKAGMWAIPEKAVVLGGVEPPGHSLSRRGSSNEGPAQDVGSNASNIASRRVSSEARAVGDKKNAVLAGIAQIEESEALLGYIFHDFLVSGQLSGALEKLRNSGAFEKDGETNVFARTSKSIVDALAKHWTTTRGAEIVATAVVSTQLMDKQQKHQNFLQFLALSKCHEELCSKKRHTLQTIMEHGEKLAGLIQLRELQNNFAQRRPNRVTSPCSNSDPEASSGSLWDLIQSVGELARRNTVLLMDRDNAEVFYSKVSDLEELFFCLDNQLEYIVNAEQPFLVQNQRVCELSNACVTLVRTAMQYKNEHHMWYPSSEGLTPWYCQPVVQNGLWHIASFMMQVINGKTGHDVFTNSDIYSHFESLAEVLLEAYNGALTAKIEREEDHKALLEEYWNRRDALLGFLYQLVRGFAKAGIEGVHNSEEDQNEEKLKRLYSQLLSIAKRHEGYQSLWQICCDLNDLELLKNLMRESMGPKGGFSDFVFRQLFENRQYPKLLRLGEEFQGELSTFLKRHPDLLWLHEVFLQQFSSASQTLHELALAQNNASESAVEDRKVPGYKGLEPSLAERRHLLNLSKIAALAGKDNAQETRMRRVEADLKILQLQEELVAHFPDNDDKENIGKRLLPPSDLIKMCLDTQNPQLVLRSFDIFAWTSSSFRRCNRSLLEECWKIAVDLDDWNRLYQTSMDEGWSDEDTIRILGGTVLFKASRRCYGPEAETFEGQFDEVLPLGQESAGSSVEAVLRHHKDFPDAGKLMLTAINLGGAQIDIGGDVEAFTPME